MRYHSFAVSDSGRLRDNNEDNACVNDYYCENSSTFSWGHESKEATAILAAVFDGMGGEANGEIASKMAAENMAAICEADFSKEVDAYVERTNKAIALYDTEHNMGTTFAALYAKDDMYYIYNIGDSRVYLYRDGRLKQMTHDHNMVRRLQREGILTKEQADRHPQRNSISQFLGMKDKGMLIRPDCFKEEMVHARPEDIILLCTDGLTEMVSDEAICNRLSQPGTIKDKTQDLLQMALDAGGKDNVTIILAEAV